MNRARLNIDTNLLLCLLAVRVPRHEVAPGAHGHPGRLVSAPTRHAPSLRRRVARDHRHLGGASIPPRRYQRQQQQTTAAAAAAATTAAEMAATAARSEETHQKNNADIIEPRWITHILPRNNNDSSIKQH